MSDNPFTPAAAARFRKRVARVKRDKVVLKQTQVIEMKLRFPEYTSKTIAKLMHLPVVFVQKTLSSEDAKRRLSEARDISPFLQRAAVVNTIDSMLLTGKAVRRARRELDKDRPNSAVLQAGMKGAGDTLTGFGVYKQKIDVRGELPDDSAQRLLAEVEAELKRRLVEVEVITNTPTDVSVEQ